MIAVETFEAHLREAEIIDPDGIHSEFSQIPGLHGQKVDFDKIPDGSPLFDEWVEVTAENIAYHFPGELRPEVLVATANGTNRLAEPVAKRLGSEVLGLVTIKANGIVMLPPESVRQNKIIRPKLALVLDDVGTTGRNAASAADYTKKAGSQNVEVLYTWQRQDTLIELEGKYRYRAIIKKILPTFTPEDCRRPPDGLCARKWKLNPHGK